MFGLEANDGSVYLGQTHVSQNHNMKVANKSYVDLENFKYLGPTLTNQNSMHEGIRSRLNSGNTCSHLAHNPQSTNLRLKNINIKIYRGIIILVALCGRATWYFTSREEHRPKVFKNRMLRKIF